jgi:hypothetical protein
VADAFDVLDDLAESMDYALVGPVDSRVHEIHAERFPFNAVCHVGRARCSRPATAFTVSSWADHPSEFAWLRGGRIGIASPTALCRPPPHTCPGGW